MDQLRDAYSAEKQALRAMPRMMKKATSQTLRDALHDPHNCYAHFWQAGDVVVADNYTLLHGREAYAGGCGRHLRRVHVLGDPPLINTALRWSLITEQFLRRRK